MIPEQGESAGGGAASAIDATAKDSETLHVRVALTRPASGFSLDLAFDVPPGITVLFGPSGSGKSTTLAAIAGLVRPHAGRVALGSRAWFDASTGVDLPV